jgi:telomere length regulation protein
MNEILTAVRTTRHEPTLSVSTDVERHTKQTANVSTNISEPASPEDLLAILKSHPSEEQLQEILSILDPANKKKTNLGFDIRLPGPTSAQFLQTLVNTTIPDHWSSLTQQGAREQDGHVARTRSLLLRCFCSIAGVSALVANLRTLVTAIRSSPERVKDPGRRLTVRDTASLLSALLKPKDFVYRLYDDISSLYDTTSKRQVTWRELCALLAGGRLLSTAAEGLSCIREGTDLASISWIGDGAKYACWLGKNLGYLVNHGQSRDEEYQKSTALIIGRALSLGYTGQKLAVIYAHWQ